MKTYTAVIPEFEAFKIARITNKFGIRILNGYAGEGVEWTYDKIPEVGDYFIRHKAIGHEYCKSEEFFNKNFKILGDDK